MLTLVVPGDVTVPRRLLKWMGRMRGIVCVGVGGVEGRCGGEEAGAAERGGDRIGRTGLDVRHLSRPPCVTFPGPECTVVFMSSPPTHADEDAASHRHALTYGTRRRIWSKPLSFIVFVAIWTSHVVLTFVVPIDDGGLFLMLPLVPVAAMLGDGATASRGVVATLIVANSATWALGIWLIVKATASRLWGSKGR